MRFGIMTAALILVAAAPVSATRLPADLTAAVEAFDAAQVHGDRNALNALLADDYILLNGDGSQEDREAFIKDFTAPGFHLEPFDIREPIVRTWPGGAIMGGISRLVGRDGGGHFDRCIRFSDIWELRGHRWQVAYTQISRPPAGSCQPTA